MRPHHYNLCTHMFAGFSFTRAMLTVRIVKCRESPEQTEVSTHYGSHSFLWLTGGRQKHILSYTFCRDPCADQQGSYAQQRASGTTPAGVAPSCAPGQACSR